MTYSSCCGSGNYASQRYSGRGGVEMLLSPNTQVSESNYESQLKQIEQDMEQSDHSWYQNGSGNPGYSAGLNNVAAMHMKTPKCGKYKAVNNLLL